MSTVVPVHLSASFDGTAREVLASLPLSYTGSEAVRRSVVVVDGHGDWVEATAAAVRAGALGVIIARPGPADLDGLVDLARDHGTTVVVDTGWAGNPAVAAAAELVGEHAGAGRRLECRVILAVGSDLDRALLDQLALVRALLGPVSDLSFLTWTEHGYFAAARAADTTVSLTSVLTDATAATAQTRMLLGDGGIDLALPASDTARPGRVVHTTPHGATQLPTLFETAQRATWRRLHTLLRTGTASSDLDDLEADIVTLTRSRDRSSA